MSPIEFNIEQALANLSHVLQKPVHYNGITVQSTTNLE
jgi:hypothetical protein